MKGQCLLFRGMIKEDQGELVDAKQDWLNALAYPRAGTFLRYNLESNIGKVCETLGLREEAVRWYWTALSTCSQGDDSLDIERSFLVHGFGRFHIGQPSVCFVAQNPGKCFSCLDPRPARPAARLETAEGFQNWWRVTRV